MDRRAIMEIEWECIKLSNAFAYLLDSKDYVGFANLFTEDGLFLRDGVELVGRAAIIDTMQKRPSGALTRHVTTGHHFTHVSETMAKAEAVNRSYFGLPGGSLPLSLKPEQMIILDFSDVYRKTDEGWRIAERRTQVTLLPDALRPMFGFAPR